jgi:carboxypeptidase Taq
MPDLDEHVAAGELMPLREWLRDRIHRHGGKFTSAELMERVVGGPVLVAPFVSYLKSKLSDIYEVEL